jgi:hypothetical protein
MMDFVHHAYKVALVQKSVREQTFVITSTYDMLPHPSALNILPPPRYNMKNEDAEYKSGWKEENQKNCFDRRVW